MIFGCLSSRSYNELLQAATARRLGFPRRAVFPPDRRSGYCKGTERGVRRRRVDRFREIIEEHKSTSPSLHLCRSACSRAPPNAEVDARPVGQFPDRRCPNPSAPEPGFGRPPTFPDLPAVCCNNLLKSHEPRTLTTIRGSRHLFLMSKYYIRQGDWNARGAMHNYANLLVTVR